MKKIILLTAVVFTLFSCKSTIDTKSQTGLKGNWTISSVTYAGSDMFKVNSFNIADSKCFEGSQWQFISMSNKGNMELNKVGCPSFSSPIVWTITKDGDFTLKIIEGEKAKNVSQGYFLKVRNQTENTFQLVDQVNIGGKNTEVIYQFVKS